METTRVTATESPGASPPGASLEYHTPTSNGPPAAPLIKVRRRSVPDAEKGKDVDLFTMSIGEETIELLPLRNWGQLDTYKWRARGRLPGTPAGLEITDAHVKLLGETVMLNDPEGCAKLERLFEEWLAMEKQTLELARQKAKAKPAGMEQASRPAEPQPIHFTVEVGKAGQVHIRCLQGKDTMATIGLNAAGFHSLFSQGLMKKPKALQVGALHDWLELDGVMFSFEKGNDDSEKLARALNEKYVPPLSRGGGKDVVVFANPASATGFDIQFPVSVGGMTTAKRRPLDEHALELLQDPNKCGLLHKGIVIKIAQPHLIFKQKTPDGGERYFESTPANHATVVNEDGEQRLIDLSKPVNYLRLSTSELTAVLNHPAIHQHGKATPAAGAADAAPAVPLSDVRQPTAPEPFSHSEPTPKVPQASAPPPQVVPCPPPPRVAIPAAAQEIRPVQPPGVSAPPPGRAGELDRSRAAIPEPPGSAVAPDVAPTPVAIVPEKPKPNLWLKEPLGKPSIRHDWLACIVYSEIAQRFGNSNPGKLGLSECWCIALSETRDPEDPTFKGFFLTQKGGFGFLNQGHIVRFNKGVAFLGTQENALEGIDVALIGVGLDELERPVFIVNEPYRNKFGVPPQAVEKELASLRECGILVLGVEELVNSPEAIEIAWTVSKEQASVDDIRADEHVRPEPAEPGS